MTTLAWIIGSGVAMSAVALVGSVTLLLSERTLKRVLLPLVAFATGALLGGAMFHMMPKATAALGGGLDVYVAFVAGFVVFYLLEQVLHWHHCHRGGECDHVPIGPLVLVADGLHNFIGGLAVGASFLLAIPVGISAWFAAVAHEVPQELGDFAVLVHSGWRPRRALVANLVSALSFPVGAVTAYFAAGLVDVTILVPFAAGNFVYIGATDLLPQITRRENVQEKVVHTLLLLAGLGLLWVTAVLD